MSAANAANTQVRRPVAPTRTAAAPVARPAAHSIGFDDHEEEFRLHLADIPMQRESLEIEGLKPTLLSRLLDLVMPLKP